MAPAQPAALDCSTIVASLDQQSTPAWPASSPLKVDWPWGGEPDPVPGDIVGWNWQRQEIAVVTAVPPATNPWPYTLTVEIRPMPEEWRQVKVFDLNSGQRFEAVEWYTRWNRAYQNNDNAGSGWLAVVQEGERMIHGRRRIETCPFCGSLPMRLAPLPGPAYAIGCQRCNARGPVRDTEVDAIRKWNARQKTVPKKKSQLSKEERHDYRRHEQFCASDSTCETRRLASCSDRTGVPAKPESMENVRVAEGIDHRKTKESKHMTIVAGNKNSCCSAPPTARFASDWRTAFATAKCGSTMPGSTFAAV